MTLKPWRFRPVCRAVPTAALAEYLSLCGRRGTEMKPTSSRVLVAVTSEFDSYTHRFSFPRWLQWNMAPCIPVTLGLGCCDSRRNHRCFMNAIA